MVCAEVCAEALSSTTWIFSSERCVTTVSMSVRKSRLVWVAERLTVTFPVRTSWQAYRSVVPCRT